MRYQVTQTTSLYNPLIRTVTPRYPRLYGRITWNTPRTRTYNLCICQHILNFHLRQHHNHCKLFHCFMNPYSSESFLWSEFFRWHWNFCAAPCFWTDLTHPSQFNSAFLVQFDSYFLIRFESNFTVWFNSHCMYLILIKFTASKSQFSHTKRSTKLARVSWQKIEKVE